MGSPIRVLHVVVNMNRGGAETLIMNLYRNIDRTKVQFDFLTCKEGVFDAEIIKLGGKIHRIPYISDVGHFKYIQGLNQFFTNHNEYQIVHSHMDKMSGLVMRAAKKVGIPVRISHSHNTQSEGGIVTKIYKWYAGHFILSSATNLFACSSSASEWLFSKKSNRSTLIKNGIEQKLFSFSPKIRTEVREELKIGNDIFVIGHVGRFCHQKNHSMLIDIFAHFNQNHDNSKLILVGDGPLRGEIETKIKIMNLENKVILLGIRSDINRLLQAFDTFVFPSFHEGLPVSLIEAQGAGLPCIISDTISNEVDLGIGLIHYVPINSQNEWIQRIQNTFLVKNKRISNPNVLSEKGYDIKITADHIVDLYLGVSGG